MFVKLLRDFHLPGEPEPVHDLETCVRKYIYSWVFVLDFITIIPFHKMLPMPKSELFYIIKVYRMIYVLKYFSISFIFKAIKDKMHQINLEKVRRDPIYAEDNTHDNN